MRKSFALLVIILLGVLAACSGDAGEQDAGVGGAAAPTPTPTSTATPDASDQAIGGQPEGDDITPVPDPDESDSDGDQAAEDSDLEFVSTDFCDEVPKELVPCGTYDIVFTSDSMICGGTPFDRRPEDDRDTLLFQPGRDGEGNYVDTPVQTVASDGSLIFMMKTDESEGSKSYEGNGVFPSDGVNPQRSITWEFEYDTTSAKIEGTLVAEFETAELGSCTVEKAFEGTPG